MKQVCVFAGSSPGSVAHYQRAAHDLGTSLVERGYGLVYGGAHVGLMGAVADAVLDAGGQVIGVIPRGLVDREVAHQGLTDLRIVESMHERKGCMSELADAFVALPGGLGTLEELFEMFTWAQLGLHTKPLGILNTVGYYDRLLQFLDHVVTEHFLSMKHRSMMLVDDDPLRLLERLEDYEAPVMTRWLDRDDR